MPTPSHRSARRRGMLMGAALKSRSNKKAQVQSQTQPVQAQQPAEPKQPANNLTTQLTELKSLLDQGILTQAEFDAKKQQILGL